MIKILSSDKYGLLLLADWLEEYGSSYDIIKANAIRNNNYNLNYKNDHKNGDGYGCRTGCGFGYTNVSYAKGDAIGDGYGNGFGCCMTLGLKNGSK